MRAEKIRTSKELKEIIDYVRAKRLMEGKSVPTISEVTKVIASKISKEEFYKNEYDE